jgi:hypothetical protein
MVVITLVIVAFLSTYVGNFTITIINYQSRLTMSTSSNMADSTTFAKAPGFPNATPYTVGEIDDTEANGTYDVAEGGSHNVTRKINTKGDTAVLVYAYTFYVRNVGTGPTNYYYGMTITEEKNENYTYMISDILRVRIYQNLYTGGTETHKYMDYTKKNKTADEVTSEYTAAGKTVPTDMLTYLSACDTQVTGGTLTYFADGADIINAKTSADRLQVDETLRYTILMWIEGDDPECVNDYPEQSNLRISAFVAGDTAD